MPTSGRDAWKQRWWLDIKRIRAEQHLEMAEMAEKAEMARKLFEKVVISEIWESPGGRTQLSNLCAMAGPVQPSQKLGIC